MNRKRFIFLLTATALCFLLGFFVGELNLALPLALSVGVAVAFIITGRDILRGEGDKTHGA